MSNVWATLRMGALTHAAVLFMKTVIQSLTTNLFVGNGPDWSVLLADARGFEDSLTALSYCHEHGLRHVQVVLTFGAPEYDLILPVRDELSKAANAVVHGPRV